jgi:4-carboxymuconolactone decarboxylase
MDSTNTNRRRDLLQKAPATGALSAEALAQAAVEQPTTETGEAMQSTHEDRYARGWRKLQEIDGEAGHRVIESLRDIAPDLGRFVVEFPFGDIYTRPGLDLRSREIATVAALTAMGNAPAQLKVHLQAALNVNVSREELIEVIIQMAVYAGFPAALNAMFVAKEVFAERGKAP